jgi:hypothetical protein
LEGEKRLEVRVLQTQEIYIFTFVHKRNKTTINRNEIKHNERDKIVYKTKTKLYLRALLLTNPTKNTGSSFL